MSATHGYDNERNTFTQSYGSQELDASLLMIPLVGFLPPTDERVHGTVEAIERELLRGRLRAALPQPTGEGSVDGLPAGEGAFLACSFWLADDLALIGRHDEARELFERLLSLAQRRGAARRGVRPDGRPAGRQLPAGLQPCPADRHRSQPVLRARAVRAAATRRSARLTLGWIEVFRIRSRMWKVRRCDGFGP